MTLPPTDQKSGNIDRHENRVKAHLVEGSNHCEVFRKKRSAFSVHAGSRVNGGRWQSEYHEQMKNQIKKGAYPKGQKEKMGGALRGVMGGRDINFEGTNDLGRLKHAYEVTREVAT